MSHFYFIGYYTKYSNPNDFFVFPSSNSKMGYIVESLKSIGVKLNIISLGESSKLKSIKVERVDDLETVIYLGTFPNINFLFRFFSRSWLLFQLLYFLIFRIRRRDTLIVYHTFFLLPLVRFAKALKRFKLIYEVEEIYSAAWQLSESSVEREIRNLRRVADKYILVNDLINGECSFNKPFLVCYGNYKSVITRSKKIDFNLIKIVYAGVIGDLKSDVYLAIESMKHLPLNYRLYIVGYGSTIDVARLKDYIVFLDNVQFDGLLSGIEYDNYLLSCDIGISTRVLPDHLSKYTFPSKVLAYLSYGLITVSSKISSVYCSRVADSIYFVENLTAQAVADTILSIDYNNLKNNQIVTTLDLQFKSELRDFIYQ